MFAPSFLRTYHGKSSFISSMPFLTSTIPSPSLLTFISSAISPFIFPVLFLRSFLIILYLFRTIDNFLPLSPPYHHRQFSPGYLRTFLTTDNVLPAPISSVPIIDNLTPFLRTFPTIDNPLPFSPLYLPSIILSFSLLHTYHWQSSPVISPNVSYHPYRTKKVVF